MLKTKYYNALVTQKYIQKHQKCNYGHKGSNFKSMNVQANNKKTKCHFSLKIPTLYKR